VLAIVLQLIVVDEHAVKSEPYGNCIGATSRWDIELSHSQPSFGCETQWMM